MDKPTNPLTGQDGPGSAPEAAERAHYWIARLASKDMSAEELDRLENWLAQDDAHARAFSRARALWQDLELAADALSDPAPAALRPRSGQPCQAGAFPRHTLLRAVPLALAASVAALAFGPTLLLEIRSDYRTDVGSIERISLADGSTATLDSASAIAVDFDGNRRVVHLLEGRAWFDVRHETRPFLVEAMDGVTRDIGTAFEVEQDGDAVRIAVTQGAVEVRGPKDRAGLPLAAGDRAQYASGGTVRLPARAVAELASWRNGELLLDREAVSIAVRRLSRYRQAPIWMMGNFDGVEPVSGLFLASRPDEALETIARMRALRLVELPGGIILLRPPD